MRFSDSRLSRVGSASLVTASAGVVAAAVLNGAVAPTPLFLAVLLVSLALGIIGLACLSVLVGRCCRQAALVPVRGRRR